jgi:adenylate kinase
MLRAAIRDRTRLGAEAQAIVERGELVPDTMISAMMGERLQAVDAANGFVLDGFPRTLGQAEFLDRTLADQGRSLDRVISLEVPEEEITERLAGRRACGRCGTNYHISFQAPRSAGICDTCGGTLVRRPDDAPEVIRARLRVYREQTEPILDHYRRRGLLAEVDGRGAPDDVTERIERALRSSGG